jgi:hypothetical protein
MWWHDDPAGIDLRHQIRTASFENPSGAKGAAATAHGGRKGAPNKMLAPGERVVLADLTGPGRVRHLWMTFPPMPPEQMRALWMEITYDDAAAPSVSVPCLDFFGLPHGRPVAYASTLSAAQEGRGFNSWVPMPFGERIRIELVHGGTNRLPLYYQVAFTLGPEPDDAGRLHVAFRRENPTRLKRDFTIVEGLAGPGRFLGCNVGIRVLQDDAFSWYGEGEVKMYLDGDDAHPTWCGTGLEDYVGSAWGMGAHATPLQGAPLIRQPPQSRGMPDYVSFYRWHLPDPIVYRESLRVTLQQIGALPVPKQRRELRQRMEEEGRLAGEGWLELGSDFAEVFGICERQDDVCATAFVYCREPQPVPRLDLPAALADLTRLPYETPDAFEPMLALLTPPGS